jgi:hypothetical protein
MNRSTRIHTTHAGATHTGATHTGAARIGIAAAALVLIATASAACGTAPVADETMSSGRAPSLASAPLSDEVPCAISADTVERRVASGAALPACAELDRVRARTWTREHCAVTADAAERRTLRHPRSHCRV